MSGGPSLRWGIAVLVCACALVAFAQDDTKTVRHHRVENGDPAAAKISEAESDIGKQDYSAAEDLLKEVLAAKPDNYLAWYDLGFVYRAMGQKDESIAAYRSSVAAKPDVFESNLSLGLELAQAGNPDAEKFLRAATQLTPVSNPDDGKKHAWMALGQFLQRSKPDDAAAAYQQAAVVDPYDPEPHLLAASLLETTRPADAEKEYKQALADAPESPDALAALTNFYMRQRRYSDAETALRKLTDLHPNDAAAHLQLGRMLAIAGKNDEAIAQMKTGLSLDPSDSHAQHDLADLCLQAGKFSDAEHLYAQLSAAYPGDAGYHSALGRALLEEKKFAEAQNELQKAVQLKPDLGPVYGDLAVAADENKNYQLAIQAVDMRAKYLPEIPMTYFLRATAYDNLKDEKNAARYYHQFLEVAAGKFPDQEWQATHRLIAIEPKK